MNELDFGWGNPYFLLEILRQTNVTQRSDILTTECSYGDRGGNPELIKHTKEVIEKITGSEPYPYIIITNGATSAINIILRHYKQCGIFTINTQKYSYPIYPKMIANAGLDHRKTLCKSRPPARFREAALIDSPSNPEGKLVAIGDSSIDIWDSVYHNKIYISNPISEQVIPGHKIMVGSYSKLLGLTGARVGWIALDDKDMYERLLERNRCESVSVSLFSQKAIIKCLSSLDLDEFMLMGNRYLNNNRSEIQLLEKYFDGQPIQENGMFYMAQANKTTLELLNKCNVKYVDLGEGFIRLSLGQTHANVSTLISRIKRQDRC